MFSFPFTALAARVENHYPFFQVYIVYVGGACNCFCRCVFKSACYATGTSYRQHFFNCHMPYEVVLKCGLVYDWDSHGMILFPIMKALLCTCMLLLSCSLSPMLQCNFTRLEGVSFCSLACLQLLCFRGTCLLTCLSGRVEVLGFTIEQGQQPYPLFSPPSHCPLTIRAMTECTASTKSRKESQLEAKGLVRKYLSSGKIPHKSYVAKVRKFSVWLMSCVHVAEPRKRLLSEVDAGSCVMLLQPLDTSLTRFLGSFDEFNQLFGLSSVSLPVFFFLLYIFYAHYLATDILLSTVQDTN